MSKYRENFNRSGRLPSAAERATQKPEDKRTSEQIATDGANSRKEMLKVLNDFMKSPEDPHQEMNVEAPDSTDIVS